MDFFVVVVWHVQWCIATNGGGYTQRGVAQGLKIHCLFMITEVSIHTHPFNGPFSGTT